jgi:hypothetical protein
MQTMGPMTHDDELMAMPSPAPPHWAEPRTHQECSLHQLSPYSGKLKSSIAQDLSRLLIVQTLVALLGESHNHAVTIIYGEAKEYPPTTSHFKTLRKVRRAQAR